MMRWRRWIVLLGLVSGALAAALGCSTVLGLGDYKITDDGGTSGSDAPGSCDVDLATQCFPCTPTKDPEFLNACTGSMCVPFDDKARVKYPGFNPDAAFPMVPDLPPVEAGPDGGTG